MRLFSSFLLLLLLSLLSLSSSSALFSHGIATPPPNPLFDAITHPSSSPSFPTLSPSLYPKASFDDSNALDAYIAKPDPSYNYTYLPQGTFSGNGYTAYVLNMTSQTWLTEADVDRPVWFHFMTVIVPTKLNPAFTNRAMMWVTEGDWTDGIPTEKTAETAAIILATVPLGVVAVCLFSIPMQPLVFTADPTKSKRTEDNLIAFAWSMYIKDTSRPEWLPRLPMVKAVVKAMDTIQSFLPQISPQSLIDEFVIAGASKRGWTTWLVGAIQDPRVIAIIPIVMSALNFNINIIHHYRSLGGWSFAFEPYYALNFTENIGTPGVLDMMQVVDPFSYKDRLARLPNKILAVSGSGDPFFLEDDDHYWLNDTTMASNVRRLMQPNCEHSMAECIPKLLFAMQGFLAGILNQDPTPPEFYWTISKPDGAITLYPQQGKVTTVTMWVAHTISTERRDFRLIKMGPNGKPTLQLVLWKPTVLSPQADGSYLATQPMPANGTGWTGFFIAVGFASYQDTQYLFTTQVSVIPDYLPFPSCGTGLACRGKLV